MVSYLAAQKQKVRITLDLEVFQDFDARQIDWDKLFNLEPSENVEAYVEEFDNVDYWCDNRAATVSLGGLVA